MVDYEKRKHLGEALEAEVIADEVKRAAKQLKEDV